MMSLWFKWSGKGDGGRKAEIWLRRERGVYELWMWKPVSAV